MHEGDVNETEKKDIQDLVGRILRDLGHPEPPLRLADVRALLRLDLKYYKSSDPSLIQELTHRFTLLARKTLPDLGRHLASALSKSKLCAFWVPDTSRILLDESVPKLKQRWIEAHEIIHSVIPWHRQFLLGDNVEMVDPACRAILELEANYGAGRLMSLGDRLTAEARDLDLSFNSIKQLAQRYGNSIVSTFWRTVEGRDPAQSVFGIVSVHPLYPHIGRHDGPYAWRYFIRSDAFRLKFSTITPETVFELITQHCTRRRTGPIFSAVHVLADAAGDEWEFQVECFCTTHAVLTFGFPLRRRACAVPAGVIF